MTDTGPPHETVPTPGTYVQVGSHGTHPDLLRALGSRPPTDTKLAPDVALVLIAVLLAAAEQVNGDKLAQFGVTSKEDLTLLALAMAFRGDDTGLVGDVFEWSLLLALNNGDPGIAQLVSDALLLANVPVDQPQRILVAAEPGRLVTFSPQLPSDATLASSPPRPPTLRRQPTGLGRHPHMESRPAARIWADLGGRVAEIEPVRPAPVAAPGHSHAASSPDRYHRQP